ncbi:Fic/DOC family protein [Actinomyces wuliandei]|uniref:Fic/DOC family protein n=1 Tax=Actinomyces wuliandei TaxID=2057743 RepID=UPI001C5722D4|nr:Fic family protein [Actinomyces wuliandei]
MRLDAAMNDYASAAMAELRIEPVPPQPGYEYLRYIHTRMFERIVPGIAGRLRDVNVQAVGTGVVYARPEYIQDSLSQLFDRLGREDYLTGLDAATFATRLAERWGDLTAIHPYRDGNTRSQSFYMTVLAERAGHPVNWRRVDVDTLRALRLRAVVGNPRPLADYLVSRLLSCEPSQQTPSLESRISSFALRASYPQAATEALRAARRVPVPREGQRSASPYEVCQRYAAGELDREEAVAQLVAWPWVPAGEMRTSPGDDLMVVPEGTVQDLFRAERAGLIDVGMCEAVLDALYGDA